MGRCLGLFFLLREGCPGPVLVGPVSSLLSSLGFCVTCGMCLQAMGGTGQAAPGRGQPSFGDAQPGDDRKWVVGGLAFDASSHLLLRDGVMFQLLLGSGHTLG